MGTPGIGFQEILVIAAVLIIFIRPHELPVIFRKIGKIWAKIYYYYTLAKRELHSMEQEIGIEKEMKEIRAINARMKSEVANFDKIFNEKEAEKADANQVTNTDKEIKI